LSSFAAVQTTIALRNAFIAAGLMRKMKSASAPLIEPDCTWRVRWITGATTNHACRRSSRDGPWLA
jgi:hypothetical protein